MMEDKLRLINVTKDIFNIIYSSLLNCPKEHIELKKIVLNELNIYLRNIYISNDISDINRRKMLKEEVLYQTKNIASLITILYENKLINQKCYLEIGSKLQLLIRLLKGWVKI